MMMMDMASPDPSRRYPHVYIPLKDGADIPEEGEIRFRYSRIRISANIDKNGATGDVQLCLTAITDICDCEGKDDEENDLEEKKDTSDIMDELMSKLAESDMEDDSEDSNPEKY